MSEQELPVAVLEQGTGEEMSKRREAIEKDEEEFKENKRKEIEALAEKLQAECDEFNNKQQWTDCIESERAWAMIKRNKTIHISEWFGFYEKPKGKPGSVFTMGYNAPIPEKSVKIESNPIYLCKLTQKQCEKVARRSEACPNCNLARCGKAIQ